jgi:replicative DNA helicase
MQQRPKGREIPHSEEAERGFLSSILQQPTDTLSKSSDRVTPGHFYNPALRLIFETLHRMYDTLKPIDLLTITQEMRDDGQLEKVGGAAELTALLDFVPTAANSEYYLEIMVEKFICRETIRICTDLGTAAYDPSVDVRTALDNAQAAITGLALQTITRPTIRHIEKGIDDTVVLMERAHTHRGAEGVIGLPSGFFDIDRMTGGFQPKQLILVAARTSQGKSAFVLNIAYHLVHGSKYQPAVPVLIFSLEMSYDEIAARYFAQGSKISLKRWRDGKFSDEMIEKLIPQVAVRLKKTPLYVDDTPQLSIADFKARARLAAVSQRIGCIVVDYLQLMSSLTKRGKENKVIELGEITAGLKSMAKELNIPIIACAQLNRDPEKRPTGFPRLSDLRESGSMENDADTVILLWRPDKQCDSDELRVKMANKLELPGADDAEKIRNLASYAEAILAKQRNGPTGSVRLRFEGELTQFQNTTEKMWSNKEGERQAMLQD